jgi:hypothetical protein
MRRPFQGVNHGERFEFLSSTSPSYGMKCALLELLGWSDCLLVRVICCAFCVFFPRETNTDYIWLTSRPGTRGLNA